MQESHETRLEDLKFEPQADGECRKVFLVPGSNSLMYQEVMKFLKKLDLEAVVSKSRINYTESMEQKFIDYPQIKLAIVLLSGDDFVYPKDGRPGNAKLRASQDNVFELAYFLAKLSRQGVFILYQEQRNFLLPTDLMNAIYTPYLQGGHWRHELSKRLKEREYRIEGNVDA
jgi:predicted nucleotide-binding protein